VNANILNFRFSIGGVDGHRRGDTLSSSGIVRWAGACVERGCGVAIAGTATGDEAPAATVEVDSDVVLPVPAPVLFLAGGLLAVAAMVRWRQKMAAKAE
jgi:hypothetical protein